jgi:16S rRNA (uracil1498-N3)-methyltransferase
MSLPRFYIPPSKWVTESPSLPLDEAKHCSQVLRLVAGDEVVLFNGEGVEQRATIDAIDRREVRLRPGEVRATTTLKCKIGLGQALPKGKNMELIIQKGTELGVAEVRPVVTKNTIVRVDEADGAKKREKWQRVAIEACKQCGQNFLPKVESPAPLGEVLAAVSDSYDLLIIASLQPGAMPLKSLIGDYSANHDGALPKSVFMLIGPEGDFTESEVAAALTAGARPMTLGPIILRTETAAMYCLSVLGHELF